MSAREEQARFFGKLGALVAAGVPLLDAFEKAAAGVRSPAFAAAVGRIVGRAYRGTSVTESFAAEAGLFSPEVLSLIEHGEKTGDLDRKAVALAAALAEGIFDAPEPAADDDDAGLVAAVLDAGSKEAVLEAGTGGFRLLLRAGDRPPECVDPQAWIREAERREGVTTCRGRTVRVRRCPRRDGVEYVIRIAEEADDREPPGSDWIREPGGLILLAGLPGRRRDEAADALLRFAAHAGRRTGRHSAIAGDPLPAVVDYDAASVSVWPDLAHLEVVGLSEPASREAVMVAAGAALSGLVVLLPVTATDGPSALGRLRGLGLPEVALRAGLLGAVVIAPEGDAITVAAPDLLRETS